MPERVIEGLGTGCIGALGGLAGAATVGSNEEGARMMFIQGPNMSFRTQLPVTAFCGGLGWSLGKISNPYGVPYVFGSHFTPWVGGGGASSVDG